MVWVYIPPGGIWFLSLQTDHSNILNLQKLSPSLELLPRIPYSPFVDSIIAGNVFHNAGIAKIIP